MVEVSVVHIFSLAFAFYKKCWETTADLRDFSHKSVNQFRKAEVHLIQIRTYLKLSSIAKHTNLRANFTVDCQDNKIVGSHQPCVVGILKCESQACK